MASKYDGATVKILNWEKYTHRDVVKLKTVEWFRAEVKLFTGTKRRKMPLEAKGFWMTVLAFAAEEKTGKFVYDSENVEFLTGLIWSAQDRYMDLFLNSKFLEALCINPAPKSHAHNKTLHNTTKDSIGTIANALVPGDGSKEIQKLPQEKKPRFSDEQKEKARAFCAAYAKAYALRFPNGRPEDLNDGKTRGQILVWIKDYPLDRACELIQAYFQLETKWFGTKGYDFFTFRNNLNKIGQALDSGRDPDGNSIDWGKVFGKKAVTV